MPLNEDIQQPPQSQAPSDQQVSASVSAYMTDHAADLKGAKGDQGIQGLKGDAGQPGTTGAKGDAGSPGDSYVKVRSKVSVAAQSTVGTYTLPAINFGANKFTQSPVISCDVETSANNVVLSVRFAMGGTVAGGFTCTPTITAMNTTVSILVLGSVSLLAAVPACALHVTASEPS